jgi:hypothetical protein
MARYITETRNFWVAPGRERTYTMKSKRESRFAQLCEYLVAQGSVIEWWYEPKTFHCERMYRRERFYTPDFRLLLDTDADVFGTGTAEVWVEVKATLDQNGKTRLHCLTATYPEMKDKMLLMVDTNPQGKRNKTARRQRVLQDGALKYISRVLYATDWYPKFGIK